MGNGVAGVLFINDLLLHGASGHPQMGVPFLFRLSCAMIQA